MPWIFGGIGLAVAAAVAVVLVLALGGGSKSSGAAAVVEQFLKAAQHNDAATARAITCEPLHSNISGDSNTKITSYKVGKPSESGDSATVPFSVVDDTGTEQGVAEMKKQSGKWKICDINDASGSGGASGGSSGSATASLPSGLPSGFPTDLPTDLPSGFPTAIPTGSFCVTPPSGGTPICISN